jgi:serine/threonine protein kinase
MNLINNKYILLEKIGQGSFGSIYKGQNIRTNEYVAIKIEPIKNNTKLLKNESIIYHYLNNCKGIPSVKWFGKDSTNYYMVINLLGESLQKIKDKKNIFSLKLTLQIGINILLLLKTIHDNGLVHRDIKPDNFLLGLKNEHKQIFIIDFGFCKTFMNGKTHIDMKVTNNLIGSKMYASMNAHNYLELSRRDDLESLGYMMIYFFIGSLPWENVISNKNGKKDSNEEVKELKQNIIVENENLPEVLVNYMKYSRELKFNEPPNYYSIIDNFTREIKNISSKIY